MIEAGFARAQTIFVRAPAGQRDQDCALHARRPAQMAGHLIAVHPGQPDVQEHDLRPKGLRHLDRLVTVVGDAGEMPAHFEQRRQCVGSVDVVVHHQHPQARVRAALGPGRRIMGKHGRRIKHQQRQPHCESATATDSVAASADGAAVQLDQPPHQRQADAQAALRAFHVAPDLGEHLEHRRQRRGRNSDPGVADGNRHLVALAPCRQCDAAARWRVLGCIVQQVADHLRHPGQIDFEQQHFVGQVDLELVPAGFDQRHAGLDRAGDDGLQVNPLLFQIDFAGGDARDVEQVVDQVHHVRDLPLHHAAGLFQSHRIGH